MPNKRWRSMQGADDKSGGGQKNSAPGTPPKVNLGAQQKERSGGTAKTGWFSKFHAKNEGI